MISVQYPNILTLIGDHIIKGREESASFLIWYLENYYRLDTQEAIDSVCDQSGDKGVDGIYVNEADGTIDIFQTKISQNNSRKVGDTVLKEFFGTLSQFSNRQNIQNIITTGGSAQVVSLIRRLQLVNIVEQYKVRGIFVSNIELDSNGQAYLDSISTIEFVGKHKLETTFISDTRSVPQDITASFDISGVNTLVYHADSDTSAFIAPIKAVELVNMQGIADQSVFAYNVRGPLGKTNVNKDIVTSIKDKSIHKKFPLFHNGITIVANEIDESENGKLSSKTEIG